MAATALAIISIATVAPILKRTELLIDPPTIGIGRTSTQAGDGAVFDVLLFVCSTLPSPSTS